MVQRSNMKPDANGQIEFSKCVLESGNSDLIAEEGEWFTIDIKNLFDTSVIILNGYDLDRLIGFMLNKDDIYTRIKQRLGYFSTVLNQIIHKAIYQMKLGELAQISFEIDPNALDESFTKNNLNNEVVFLDLKFQIKLVSVEKSANPSDNLIYKLNENHLFDLCKEHKNEANDLYKQNHIRTAFQRYHKAISYLIIAEQILKEKQKCFGENNFDESLESNLETSDQTEKLRKQFLETKSLLYSNLAMCQLRNNNYEMALINCTKCLELDKSNLKALFRRAQARTGLNDYDEALVDYNLALKLDPSNPEIKQKKAQVEHLKKNYNQTISSNLKKFFS